MARIGYIRLQPSEAGPKATRTDALKGAGCKRVYVDTAAGALADRPQLTAALAQLGEGDQLVTPRLADPARSLPHLVGLVADLHARGANLVALADEIDTTTPEHRHVFASLAGAEQALAVERTRRGRQTPRAKDASQGGRPRTATPDKIATAKAMLATGEHTMEEIAEAVGVSRRTLYRRLSPDN